MIVPALAIAGYFPLLPRKADLEFPPPASVLPWSRPLSAAPADLPVPKPRPVLSSPGVDRVLAFIVANPGARQQEIAHALRISVSRTSQILRRLTRAERVHRERDGYVAS